METDPDKKNSHLREATRVVSHVFDTLHHSVNRNQNEPIGISAEEQSTTAQHDQDEYSLANLQDTVQLTVPLPAKNAFILGIPSMESIRQHAPVQTIVHKQAIFNVKLMYHKVDQKSCLSAL